ncbi:MAG: hypothetical protein ACRCX2_30720 [Paraclostridium sp.]
MANKEIKEIEVRVNTEGFEKAQRKIKELEADYNKMQRKQNRGNFRNAREPVFVIDPAIGSRRVGYRNKFDRAFKRGSSGAYVANAPYANMLGVRGSYNKINASNSMFATGATTPAMMKAQKDFSRYVKNKTGLRNVNRFGRKDMSPEINPQIAIDSASRLHLGQQQQRDYFARAKSSKRAYDERIKQERKLADVSSRTRAKAWDTAKKGPLELRNTIGSIATVATQAVGELTMFAGALTMVGFMAGSAFAKMMAVGDAFASSESDFLVTAGFRNSLIRSGGVSGVAGFDRANALNQRFSGLDQFRSGAMLARAGTQIREMKGNVNETTLSNLAIAAHGSAAITGETADKTMSKILEVAKKGKGTDKLGLAEMKLTKNMDENLKIIADAIKKDPIAGTILRRGTIASAMERVRSAPRQLIGGVYGRHTEQASRIFNRVGDSIMNAVNDPEVIEAWSAALTNLEIVTKTVFTDERMKGAAKGAAKWAAELTVIGGNVILGATWILENSDTVLDSIATIGKWWLRIQGLKLAVGAYKLAMDLKAVYGALAILGGGGAVSTAAGGVGAAGAKAGLGLSSALKWTLPGLFLLNSKEVGSGADKKFMDYQMMNYNRGLGLDVYDQLNLRNGVKPLNSTLGNSFGNNIMPTGGMDASHSSYMPAYNNPNAKVIVVHGEVNLDSKLHLSEEWMIGSAGKINY